MNIYVVKVSEIDGEILNYLYEITYFDKRYKNKSYFNKIDKIRTLISKILIRTIITKELKINNSNINFSTNQWGKPFLVDYPELNFNISHSVDYVLCAIDCKFIGVDIEKIKCIEYEDIAKRFFTINEFNYIMQSDLYSNLNRFYEIWTLKESYIKCIGQGLTIPLKSFSIEVNNFGDVKSIIDHNYNTYTFKKFYIESDYKIAVCSYNNKISNNITSIEQNELISSYLNSL